MNRLAWYSPLRSPFALRSARYSTAVLPTIAGKYSIEVFVDDEDAEISEEGGFEDLRAAGVKIFHFHRLHERERSGPPFIHFYCLEDNSASSYVVLARSIRPGVDVFFDVNLTNLYFAPFAHSTGAVDIDQVAQSEFGVSAPSFGDYHVRGWGFGALARCFAAGGSIIKSSSCGVFFWNTARQYAESVHSKGPLFSAQECPLKELSSLTLKTREPNDRVQIVCLAPDEVFFGEKQLRELISQGDLPTFDLKLLRPTVKFSLDKDILVACDESQDVRIFSIEYTNEDELLNILNDADIVVVALSDSKKGLPIGVIEAFSLGLPMISVDIGAVNDLPDDVLWKIGIGNSTVTEFVDALNLLCADSNLRKALGSAAADYAAREFTASGAMHDITNLLNLADLRVLKSYAEATANTYDAKLKALVNNLARESAEAWQFAAQDRGEAIAADLHRQLLAELAWDSLNRGEA